MNITEKRIKDIATYLVCEDISNICRYKTVSELKIIKDMLIKREVLGEGVRLSFGYYDSYWDGAKFCAYLDGCSFYGSVIRKSSYMDMEKINNMDLRKGLEKAISRIDEWILELEIKNKKNQEILDSERYSFEKEHNILFQNKYKNLTNDVTLMT